MNSCYLSGYIASEIELKHTKDDVPVCDFTLAVKRPRAQKGTTDFIKIVCWRQTADFVARYFRKGDGAEVEGVITSRAWRDDNDKPHISMEVIAGAVEFGKKKKENGSGRADEEPGTDFESADDDLPF